MPVPGNTQGKTPAKTNKKTRPSSLSPPPGGWKGDEKKYFEHATGESYDTEVPSASAAFEAELDEMRRKERAQVAMNAAADKFHAEVEGTQKSRVGGSRTRRRIKRLVRQANRKRACTQRRRRRKSSRLPLALSIAHELYRPRKHRRHGTRRRHRSTKHHHHGTRKHRHH